VLSDKLRNGDRLVCLVVVLSINKSALTSDPRREYKVFVQKIGYDAAATLSPDCWGVLKSVKRGLCADPECELVPTHPLNHHYFPEILLGPDLVATDFPALSDSWTRKAYKSFKE